MDPEITERLIREGRAPHLAELARLQARTADLYLYEGDNHNISANFTTAMERTIAFFDNVLK